MELGEIKKLRTKIGMSQTELASKAGVTQAHIAKIESGRVDPRFSTVNKILKCLKEEEKDYCFKYMTPGIVSVKYNESAEKAAHMMRDRSISQLPVMKNNSVIGLLTEEDLLVHENVSGLSAEEAMSDVPPLVSKNASRDAVKEMLIEFPCVIVMEKNKPIGIITRSNLIKN